MTAAAIAASSARDVGYTHAFWVYIVGNISVGVAYTWSGVLPYFILLEAAISVGPIPPIFYFTGY